MAEISLNPESFAGILKIIEESSNRTCLYISYHGEDIFLWTVKQSKPIAFRRTKVCESYVSKHGTISVDELFKQESLLRANFCKYRESGDSFKTFNFFIFCPNKAFSELFSKIQLKDPKAHEFFQNRGKFENCHFGLPPPLKIDKNDAFSFRSCW